MSSRHQRRPSTVGGRPPLVINRRQRRRMKVSGVAVSSRKGGPPAVWVIRDISAGGAALTGSTSLPSGQIVPLTLFLAGQPAFSLSARVLRQPVAAHEGASAVAFESLTE